MTVAAALLLASGVPAQGPLMCVGEIAGPRGAFLGAVQLNVDGAARFRSLHLAVGDPHFAAFWPLDRATGRRGAMASLEYRMDLTPNARFPVTVETIADGRSLGRRSFAGPTGARFLSGTGEVPLVALSGGRRETIVEIYGLRSLRFIARDSAGAMLVARDVALPDWDALGRGLQPALGNARRQADSREGCGPLPIP